MVAIGSGGSDVDFSGDGGGSGLVDEWEMEEKPV